MKKLFPLVLSAAAVLFGLYSVSFACGIVTHNEIAQRAMRTFISEVYPEYEEYLAEYQDALQPGTVFPDWGYAFGYPDESEAAHWEPYLLPLANHIYDNYPKPWDAETKKLAVFLLGASAHSISDIDWHAMEGQSEGFLEAMGGQDYDGSFGDAHDHGDFGGDVLTAAELDLTFLKGHWYVPSRDLAEVYNELGYTDVTAWDLETRMAIMFLGAHAERIFVGVLYNSYVEPSPFLAEQFQDYFSGGMDSMAARTSWYWQDIIDCVENGCETKGTPPMFSLVEDHAYLESTLAGLVEMLSGAGYSFTGERTERGVIFKLALPSSNRTEKARGSFPPADADRSITLSTQTPYDYLGTGLAVGDFNGDGIDDLAIGAPGYSEPGKAQIGAVYVSFGGISPAGQESFLIDAGGFASVLKGTEIMGRFGWSLAALDFNGDGVTDLAASAPTAGAPDLTFAGRVEIFFGGSAGNSFAAEPDVIITADEKYTNLGMALAAGPLGSSGNALLVGAPYASADGTQRGLVAIFNGTGVASGTQWTLADADQTLAGENDYDWFGAEIGFATDDGGDTIVLVGAPEYDSEVGSNVGRLYGYDENLSALFTLTGDVEQEKLGFSFASGDPFGAGRKVLAVSSPTRPAEGKSQAGRVSLYYLDEMAGDMDAGSLSPLLTLSGDEKIARFGWRAAFNDFNGDGADDLYVTQPWKTAGFGLQHGAYYLWRGGNSFPTGEVNDPAGTCFQSAVFDREHAFLGTTLTFMDFDGDGFRDLVVSARRDSVTSALGGSVTIIPTPAPKPVELTPAAAEAGIPTDFTLLGERFTESEIVLSVYSEEKTLLPVAFLWEDDRTLHFTLDIPEDAVGNYSVSVTTAYGTAVLAEALEINEADDSAPESDDDDDDDDDDSGCGC